MIALLVAAAPYASGETGVSPELSPAVAEDSESPASPVAFARSSAALAGGVHTGIPVHGVQGVGEPSFLTPQSGWSAGVDGGWIRVFVGPTEADAQEWYRRAVATLQVPPPPLALADEAAGDDSTLVVFRDGNVAVMVRAPGAGTLARRLRDAIVEIGRAHV